MCVARFKATIAFIGGLDSSLRGLAQNDWGRGFRSEWLEKAGFIQNDLLGF
jgi:hypothetical protein